MGRIFILIMLNINPVTCEHIIKFLFALTTYGDNISRTDLISQV